jgi:predicted secreted protein
VAVTLSLEGIKPQRRVTVAFRGILVVPHLLFAWVLSMVAFVVIFLAWFAALFTAQVPVGMRDFLIRVLQYQARVWAYGAFLATDVYPPFDVGPKEYPVALDIEPTEQLNRASVFFRYWLQLPAMILSQMASTGASALMFFVWLITLISGRVPTSAYMAMATILRYQMRTYAFVGMITSEYPGGLLGDRDQPIDMPSIDDDDVPPGEDPELPASPRIDRFVLTGGQKALVIVAIVLGAGFSGFSLATTNWDLTNTAELTDMSNDFEDAYEVWDDRTRDCARGDDAGCALVNDHLQSAIETYQRKLFVFEVPESAIDDGIDVIDELDDMNTLLGQMDEAGDSGEQLRLFLLVEDAKREYDDAYDDFYSAVSFG